MSNLGYECNLFQFFYLNHQSRMISHFHATFLVRMSLWQSSAMSDALSTPP